MGILLTRFYKKKTTLEILGELDEKINEIKKYGQNTEQRHKKIVGILIVYSAAVYVIAAVIFYFYFLPIKIFDQLFYITPLLIFPILIFFIKKMVSWYYKRKILKNEEKMIFMQEQKKKILDQVTEKETYKKAKEILMKFAPSELHLTPVSNKQSLASRIETSNFCTPKDTILQSENKLRHRTSVTSNSNNSLFSSKTQPLGLSSLMLLNTPNKKNESLLPRPILPQQRSYIDKLVEYVVGDGPNNRYALICRQCESHNGMALKEEFEYFAFRCCYCNFWNPARKQKPSAPKLELDDPLLNPGKKFSLQLNKPFENFTDQKAVKNTNINQTFDQNCGPESPEKLSFSTNSYIESLDCIELNSLTEKDLPMNDTAMKEIIDQ